MAGTKWQDQVPVEVSLGNVMGVGGVASGERESMGSTERETGIVEKLLNTYGFIRCCDRQARLFFHYSQFGGNLEHLKLGDPVDFEMTFDKKSGKPIAVSVAKISNDPTLGMGQQLVTGIVTAELNSEGREGRVAYENCGECFFFEFNRDNLVDPANDIPRQGHSVHFVIVQDATGNLQAGQVRSVGAASGHAGVGAPLAGVGAPLAPAGVHHHSHHPSQAAAAVHLQQQQQQAAFLTAGPMVGTVFPVGPGGVVVPVGALPGAAIMTAPLAHHPHPHTLSHAPPPPPHQPMPVAVAAGFAHNGAQVIHVMNGSQGGTAVTGRMLTGSSGLNGNNVRDGGGVDSTAVSQGAGNGLVMKVLQQHVQHQTGQTPAISIHPQHFSGQSTKQHQQQQQLQQQQLPQHSATNHHQSGAAAAISAAQNASTAGHLQINNNGSGSGQKQQGTSSNASPPKAVLSSKQRSGGGRADGDDSDLSNGNDSSACSRYQGVVCTLKDTYGFVERADVVKEIFFHCTEGYPNIALGDDVSFDISSRNNRDVAVGLQRLPPGTVVFEDIEDCVRRGTVVKLANQTDEPLDGRVKYEENGVKKEVGFGDRDLAPSVWTMQVGDPVDFQLATDRRDGLERATNIVLAVSAPTAFTKEKRLTGTVVALKDNYGFVSCDQNPSGNSLAYYFKLCEVLDSELRLDNIVQFSLAAEGHNQHGSSGYGQNGNNPRQVAIRLCKIADEGGSATSAVSSKKKTSRKAGSMQGSTSSAKCTHRGYIVALKEQYGFIEAENRHEDIFFRFSVFDGDAKELSLFAEVEYTPSFRNQRQSAEVVRLLDRGTVIGIELLSKEVHAGKIVRSLRCFTPGQEPYCGLIQEKPSLEAAKDSNETTDTSEPNGEIAPDVVSAETSKEYEFSVMSLAKKGEVVHLGDAVMFQLALCKATQQVMAVSVRAVRERRTATVESVKNQYGVLNFEVGDNKGSEGSNKKLFFHLSEVKGGVTIRPGDVVEFDVARTGRQNKFSAMNVTRLKEKEASPRPASLVNRMKAMAVSDDGPRIIVIRQPRGPDGTRGFAAATVTPVAQAAA